MITTTDLVIRLNALANEYEKVAEGDQDCAEDLAIAETLREAVSEILAYRDLKLKTQPIGAVSFLNTAPTKFRERV